MVLWSTASSVVVQSNAGVAVSSAVCVKVVGGISLGFNISAMHPCCYERLILGGGR